MASVDLLELMSDEELEWMTQSYLYHDDRELFELEKDCRMIYEEYESKSIDSDIELSKREEYRNKSIAVRSVLDKGSEDKSELYAIIEEYGVDNLRRLIDFYNDNRYMHRSKRKDRREVKYRR